MKIFGLTGGTGSGKSEVARQFRERGVPVLDADKIGHEIIAPGGSGETPVLEAFGEEIKSCGKIDRRKLGRIVFSDSAQLARLNALVHPLIYDAIRAACREHAKKGTPFLLVDAAVLGEDGSLPEWMDGLLVVDCPPEIREQRLVEHRGMDRQEVRRRMASQAPVAVKLAMADWVIDNSGTLEALAEQVSALYEVLHDRSKRA